MGVFVAAWLNAHQNPTTMSSSAITATGSKNNPSQQSVVMRTGYLRKLRTMKKKFFVLKAESADSSARLEYYDSEKKWRNNQAPKRSISLKTCFNINKRMDLKQKHVIALYTKDDCFCIGLESEEDLDAWLKALLSLQHGEEVLDGETPKPTFEHVWQVNVQEKGLGASRNILGPYRLCLTDKTLSLVCMSGTRQDPIEFSLMSIRCCGHTGCFFYMEIGRSSVTGAGDIWMSTTDTNIAQNMHDVILHAMSNNKDDFGPKPRTRSSSATESSKPISVLQPRKVGQAKPIGMSPGNAYSDRPPQPPPSSVLWPPLQRASQRRHSISAVLGNNGHHTSAISSGGVLSALHTSHQRTHSLPLSPESTSSTSSSNNIDTENNNNNNNTLIHTINHINNHHSHSVNPSYSTNHSVTPMNHSINPSYPMTPPNQTLTSTICTSSTVSSVADCHQDCYIARRGSVGNRLAAKRNSNLRSTSGRERCDSLPSSRARATSEGGPMSRPMPHLRPHSLYGRGDGPASPPSACSTDSAGSSLSIDEPDWADAPTNDCSVVGRFGHSLTPEEPVILEESCDDCASWDRPTAMRKHSPNVSSGFKSGSPSAASCGSSPLDINAGYVPMNPGDTGYVDMRLSPAASSCSITSGTPSTDFRFSEYHLDKVVSYISPLEEEETGRPLRTYSVGSRPPRVEPLHTSDSLRMRASSVGSHARCGAIRGHKASSAPLLSGSPHPPMADLMELDFTRNSSPKQNGYVEMKPAGFNNSGNLSYVDMRPNSGARNDPPYVDMSGGSSATSPMKPSVNYAPYVDMSGNNKTGTSPKNTKTSPKQDELVRMGWRTLSGDSLNSTRRATDGYVEMSGKQRKTSANSSDDYLAMTGNGGTNSRRKDRRREKNRSQPIAIQQNATIASISPKMGPPSYLPLTSGSNSSPSASPFSSLQRNKNKKNPETPTPTGCVFPFSLHSPGAQTPDSSRKCAVDATSGSVQIFYRNCSASNSSDYAPMSFGNNRTPTNAVPLNRSSSSTISEDYAEVNYEQTNNSSYDYVNYDPGVSRLPTSKTEDRDYAIMKPVSVHSFTKHSAPVRKISAPIFATAQQNRPGLTKQHSTSQISSSSNCGLLHQVPIIKPGANTTNFLQSSFKPITANLPKLESEKNKPKSCSPKTVDNLLSRQLSGTTIDKTISTESLMSKKGDDSVYSCTSESASRPSSVNSDTRPSSVNNERIGTRPASMSSEGVSSRPSSTSSEITSSSSTLVGSRPPSVSSERELHYITVEHDESGSRSPRGIKTQSLNTDMTGSSPSPVPCAQGESIFTYSSIDFIATDGLKQNPQSSSSTAMAATQLPANAKVKH